MAGNFKRGEVEVEIGGEVRLLKLGHHAIYQLEKTQGKSFQNMFNDGVSFGFILDCLSIGLTRPGKPKLPLEKVCDWLDASVHDLEYYTNKIMDCVKSTLNLKDDEGEEQAEGAADADPQSVVALTGTD